jgi:hypothetical protein
MYWIMVAATAVFTWASMLLVCPTAATEAQALKMIPPMMITRLTITARTCSFFIVILLANTVPNTESPALPRKMPFGNLPAYT